MLVGRSGNRAGRFNSEPRVASREPRAGTASKRARTQQRESVHRLVQRVRTLTGTVGRLASVAVYGRLVGLFDSLAVDDHGLRVVSGR